MGEVYVEVQCCFGHLLVAGGTGRLSAGTLRLGPFRKAASFLLLSLVAFRLLLGPIRNSARR